eukprot:TRINITY_DN19164_c0_g1_i7.p1 TRINITY_DN19164_c0_g1~~TRINITY_DN19164_c0_g1_i7.p1  ORF type:complete len:353 (-),score=68.75 TRINITY_DN19164_c0_g1_i7:426-1484(-)
MIRRPPRSTLSSSSAASDVYKRQGYNNAHPVFGGDLFEAETGCTKQHNMGQVATDGVNNLAFWSRLPPISTPLRQNPPSSVRPFNKSRTYISLVVGDGDNVAFVKGSRKSWIKDRVSRCRSQPSSCFALDWSLSPHLLHLAPEWAQWYYRQSYSTSNDFFVLPPSGHTYSYPSEMSEENQKKFVELTERDCRIMSSSGTVAWEAAGSWGPAIQKYFPKYAANGVVRSLFAVNVPYDIPILEFGLDPKKNHFKLLGPGPTPAVLFRPREWRGEGAHCAGKVPLGKRACLTAADMAKEINTYTQGTSVHIYLTSDGGASLDTLYQLVPLLDEHVEVVDHGTLARMAVESVTNGS